MCYAAQRPRGTGSFPRPTSASDIVIVTCNILIVWIVVVVIINNVVVIAIIAIIMFIVSITHLMYRVLYCKGAAEHGRHRKAHFPSAAKPAAAYY